MVAKSTEGSYRVVRCVADESWRGGSSIPLAEGGDDQQFASARICHVESPNAKVVEVGFTREVIDELENQRGRRAQAVS